MAATTQTLFLSNGQTLSIYFSAGQVVNSNVRCSLTGDATASSPFTFSVLSPCTIRDIINPATAVLGEYEFLHNGVRTGKKITTDARWLSTLANRTTYVPRYQFVPGVTYSLIQTVLQS
jgi:hypothetical protein